MSAFFACFKGELRKLTLKKKYFVFAIISAAACVLTVLIYSLIGKVAAASVGLSRTSSAGSLISEMPMTVLPVFAQVVIPLIAMMAGCDLFASEYHDLSIKAPLMRPITRAKVYTAKIFAAFTISAATLMFVFTAASVCELAVTHSVKNFALSLGSYLLDLIPLFVMVLMVTMINQFTKNSTSAMFLCIIVYILTKIGGILAPTFDVLLFTGYMQWHKVWLGTILPFGALSAKCALLLGYGIIFYSGGFAMFLKREF